MALDSLVLAVLMGIFVDIGDTANDPWRDFPLDSVTITLTVEMTETLLVETAPVVAREGIRSIHYKPAFANYRAAQMTSPEQATAYATAWGYNNVNKESLGYLAVHEIAGPVGWRFRTITVKPVNTRREEEIRWSLVHGIL